MTSATNLGSLILNGLVCALTFWCGVLVYDPDLIVSPRQEIAEAIKLQDDGSLPALSEQQLVSGDWRTE